MEITWYGHSCFRITERNMASVVTDPYDHSEVGYSALKLKGDIVTMSQDDPAHNFANGVKGSSWQISGPGEYEIGGVFLTAVASSNGKKNGTRNLVCVLDYNGVTVAHLGNLSTVPNKAQIEALGSVQVALVPVGGGGSLNAAKAAEVISLIEPGIVVPMHYMTPKSKTKLNKLDQFLKEMGVGKKVDTEDSLKVTSSSVPEETRVVVLNPAV